jgi:hypothetical protein
MVGKSAKGRKLAGAAKAKAGRQGEAAMTDDDKPAPKSRPVETS